jgi:hypothetical protein
MDKGTGADARTDRERFHLWMRRINSICSGREKRTRIAPRRADYTDFLKKYYSVFSALFGVSVYQKVKSG